MVRTMIQPRSNVGRKNDPKEYDLEESTLVGPPLPGEVIAAETADQLIDILAAELVAAAILCVRQFGKFHLALSGGNTPQSLYERLMYDPNCRNLPWAHTHLWLVDERCAPLDDERSNFRLIDETIVRHSGIPADHVHPIPAMSETADTEYESQLREVLQHREPGEDRLDFVLLGMGHDGHTASLFPQQEVLHERVHIVRRVEAEQADPPWRVTMTFPLINAARMVTVLVTGSAKAPMIERLARGHESLDELPIKGVLPVQGELKWFLDAEACGHAD